MARAYYITYQLTNRIKTSQTLRANDCVKTNLQRWLVSDNKGVQNARVILCFDDDLSTRTVAAVCDVGEQVWFRFRLKYTRRAKLNQLFITRRKN